MLSQTAEYAMRAMACLALRPDDLTSAGALAQRTKVPANYLAKVLQQLGSAGLVDGRRGVGGGYKLARPASKINLLDVIRAVSTLERIRECPLGLKNHGPNLCPLHRKTDQAIASLIALFEGSTLDDLLDGPGSNKPLCDEKATHQLTVHGKVLDGDA
ncbi:MAG: Rrf2 family transcriptional regulator [Phycisphaeraceae bacterium]|nr:MAG: Rrf2 family transcriptional regulator [Phycisphaeraceae bacterium]